MAKESANRNLLFFQFCRCHQQQAPKLVLCNRTSSRICKYCNIVVFLLIERKKAFLWGKKFLSPLFLEAMLQIKKLLQPIEDQPTSKWHHIRDKFKYLFLPRFHEDIETWYNKTAPKRHRDSFREVVKAIHLHQPHAITDSFAQHKAQHFASLYGVVMTEAGKIKTASWIAEQNDEVANKFRDAFTAIITILTVASTTKDSFSQRAVPEELPPKMFNRKKIDWESSKTADMVRQSALNPMAGKRVSSGDNVPKKRFVKPKNQFDLCGKSPLASLGMSGEGMDELRVKRKNFDQEETFKHDDGTGCSVYKTRQACRATTMSESANRIIVTSLAKSASGWVSTTRDLIKNHGVHVPERVMPEKHPAISRSTASLGMCVPRWGESQE